MGNIQIIDIGSKIHFSELAEGDVFLKAPIRLDTSLEIYLKTETLITKEKGLINSVELNMGNMFEINKNDYVYPIILE